VTKNVAFVENNDFSAHYIGTEYAQGKEDHGIFSLVFMNKNLKPFREVRR
jgi:hypothetical protein